MNAGKMTRWMQPLLIVVLAVAPTMAAPRKITLKGTIEDADQPGTRLNGITVQVMVGAVEKGKSLSKDVNDQGKLESGVYNFDVVIDDTNPVINVYFQDRTNRIYLDDAVSLLVGESPLSIPKAILKKTSARVTAINLRTHAEVLARRVALARAGRMPEAELRASFGQDLTDVVQLSAQKPLFAFDEGLQAALGRLVRVWDIRPSAALSSRDNHVMTYRVGPDIVSVVGRDGETKMVKSNTVGNPFGKWVTTDVGEMISSGAGGGVYVFGDSQELRNPLIVRPEETYTGPQSLVAAAAHGPLLASAGPGGTVTLYTRSGTGERPRRIRTLYAGPSAVRALAFAPDGGKLAAATLQGSILAWNIDSGSEAMRLELKEKPSGLKDAIPGALAFAPGGLTLAVGTGLDREGKVVLIDVGKHAISNIISGEQLEDRGGVTNVAYAKKGEFLLVEFDHRRGAILDSQSGKLKRRLSGTLVPSADGEWLGVLHEENLKDPKTLPEIKPVSAYVNP
jgi:hypothetical protein